ncbi:hypothetical protein MLD38_019702 [Melastoma candidum]|uniref:Uncharacterized protein n=1 Tax=Melastoma candidum TaxID=119954 RepID=A0ACB9QXX8_9MYRT|nr:hypothetical protein MLD38_019702 [Melastoma candidum]
MAVSRGHSTLISVHPDELKFKLEPEKQAYCDLKVVNNTEHHVAFKVKTTSPKKYFVRPNTSVIQPWDACFIRVTLQAQQEYHPDMQCRDKFLLQSTVVPPHSDIDELSPDIFNKDSGKVVEECKLKVAYVSASTPLENQEDSGLMSAQQSLDGSSDPALQLLKEERDTAFRQLHQLQLELDMMKRRRHHHKGDPGFSAKFALLVTLIGVTVGFLLNFTLTSPST